MFEPLLEAKLVVLGDSAVGKTSIIQRFCTNVFVNDPPSTITSFMEKTLRMNNRRISLQFWDTAGQEKYRSLVRSYFRDVAAAIIVYDITNQQSFERIIEWFDELRHNSTTPIEKIVIAVVGNQADKKGRMVEEADGKSFASKNGAFFFETSAKTGAGIEEMFGILAKQLLEQNPVPDEEQPKQETLQLDQTTNKTSSKCC